MRANILFLDDMESRRSIAAKEADRQGMTIDFAATATEALRKLESNDYDCVCLDHDLADEHYAGAGDMEQTGRKVAWKIAQDGAPRNVWVHSWNPDGARAMADIVRVPGITCMRLPFGPQKCKSVFELWAVMKERGLL